MYRVIVERSAEKDLRRLPLDVRFRAADKLRGLANDPRPVGSRKLAGTKHDWRIRVSDYRVVTRLPRRQKLCAFIAFDIDEKFTANTFRNPPGVYPPRRAKGCRSEEHT